MAHNTNSNKTSTKLKKTYVPSCETDTLARIQNPTEPMRDTASVPEERTPLVSVIQHAYERGTNKQKENDSTFLTDGRGVFRGGSGGLWYGNAIVGCQRKAILRHMGVALPPEEGRDSQALMFDAGRTNEDSWADVLRLGWQSAIVREEELPIHWEASANSQHPSFVVTGRPDIVLLDESGVPHVGIELKLVCSAWTAAKVLKNKPKLDHMRQAAFYSMRLTEQWRNTESATNYEVPFELWYTSRVNYAVSGDWMGRNFPEEGAAGSEHCSYSDAKLPDGTKGRRIKNTKPFLKGFALRWTSHDRLQFKAIDGTSDWVDTIITREAIEKFYSTMAVAIAIDVLPLRPTSWDFEGQNDFDICITCPLSTTCDTFEARKETVLSSFVTATRELTNVKPQLGDS